MKPILFLLFLLSGSQLFAQKVEQLLENPDITWATIDYKDIRLEEGQAPSFEQPPYLAKAPSEVQRNETLKRIPSQGKPSFTTSEVAPNFNELLQQNSQVALDVYEDEKLQKKIPKRRLAKPPYTSDKLPYLRLRKLTYYNSKEALFHSIILAAAPLIWEEEQAKYRPLFWAPVKQLQQQPDLKSPAIRLALHANYRTAVPETSKPLKAVQSFSQSSEHLFKDLEMHSNGAKRPYDYYVFNSDDKRVNAASLLWDTIVTFIPETFEERVEVTKPDYKTYMEHLDALEFYRILAWNEQEKQLLVYTYAFAPIVKRFDDKGNYLFQQHLFYRYYKQVE